MQQVINGDEFAALLLLGLILNRDSQEEEDILDTFNQENFQVDTINSFQQKNYQDLNKYQLNGLAQFYDTHTQCRFITQGNIDSYIGLGLSAVLAILENALQNGDEERFSKVINYIINNTNQIPNQVIQNTRNAYQEEAKKIFGNYHNQREEIFYAWFKQNATSIGKILVAFIQQCKNNQLWVLLAQEFDVLVKVAHKNNREDKFEYKSTLEAHASLWKKFENITLLVTNSKQKDEIAFYYFQDTIQQQKPQNKCQHNEKEIQDMRNQIKQQIQQINSLTQQVNDISNEKNNLDRRLASEQKSKQKNNEAQEKYNMISEKFENLQNTYNSSKHQFEQNDKYIKDLQKKLEDANLQIDNLKQEKNGIQLPNNSMFQLQTQTYKLMEENHQLKMQISDFQQEINKFKELNKNSLDQVQINQRNFDILKDKIIDLNKQVESLRQENYNLRSSAKQNVNIGNNQRFSENQNFYRNGHSERFPILIQNTKIVDAKEFYIGGGGFAKVYRNVIEGKPYAQKLFIQELNDKNQVEILEMFTVLLNEINTMEKILESNSKYLLELRGLSIFINNVKNKPILYLALFTDEMADDLQTFIQKFPQNQDTKKLQLSIMQQIVYGLKELDQMQLIHGDLKPKNILIDKFNNIKIGDFGSCIISQHTSVHCVNQLTYTPRYTPPELIQEQKKGKFTDIYGLGCIIFQLYSLQKPYPLLSDKQCQEFKTSIMEDYLKCNLQGKLQVPQKIEQLINNCTKFDYTDRPSINNVLQVIEDFSKSQ